MTPLPRHTAARPASMARLAWLIAGVTVVLGLSVLAARPAIAHEIAVAVVIATDEASGTDQAALVDGLRLAIDQSPDVGHAAGTEAGDHLGGVDVELTVVDDLDSPEDVGDATRSATADGAGVVVVVGDSASIAAAAAEVPPGFILAVVAAPGELDATLTVPFLHWVGMLDTEAVRAFSESFQARFGRVPPDSSAIGYDIGQVLDELLEETSGAVPDSASLESVMSGVQSRLTVTELDRADAPQTIAQPEADNGDGTGGNPTAALAVASAALAVAAVAVTVIWRRRRTSRM